jgi:hypothetical protein
MLAIELHGTAVGSGGPHSNVAPQKFERQKICTKIVKIKKINIYYFNKFFL